MAQAQSNEVKVGLFVVIALVVLGAMIVLFGGGIGLGRRPAMYEVTVAFDNVAGIVKDAKVMYGGIGVGTVRDIQLDQAGRLKINVKLAIYEGVIIRRDAKFVINQSGLLGDRYVDVMPQSGTAPPLQDGDVVAGTSSVDLSEAIRGVVDVLKQTAGTIERVDQAIKRVDETVLNRTNLQHVTATLAHVDATTSNTVALAQAARQLVDENRGRVDAALTQFGQAAEHLSRASRSAEEIVQANQADVRHVLTNMAASAERLNAILTALQEGQGTAGKLLVDPTLYDEVTRLVQNLRQHGLLYKEADRPRPTPSRLKRSAEGRVPVPARPAQ